MLEASAWKGVIRFGKWGKLNPHYIRPFKIRARARTITTQLELPDQISRVHSTFHVLNLKKCLPDIILGIPLDEIQIDNKLHFVEEPMEIMDREVKRLKQSRIHYVKVQWNSRRGLELTRECEDRFQKKYPHLITNLYHRQMPQLELQNEAHLMGERMSHPENFRHHHLYPQVLDVFKDDGRLSEAIRFTGTTRNTSLEMEKYSYGFYHKPAKDNKLLLHDLGNRDH
ncbi:hypothetical protein Tco_0246860 [Tanacetum coccineum]